MLYGEVVRTRVEIALYCFPLVTDHLSIETLEVIPFTHISVTSSSFRMGDSIYLNF